MVRFQPLSVRIFDLLKEEEANETSNSFLFVEVGHQMMVLIIGSGVDTSTCVNKRTTFC